MSTKGVALRSRTNYFTRSAILNPDRFSYCIDSARPSVKLPIRLNETMPIHMELFRLEFEGNANETIEIKQREIKAMRKAAEKKRSKHDVGPLDLEYTVKKPGLYRLLRVVDESKLEVQRRISDTLVVTCPKAAIQPSAANRCIADLSDLTIDVTGTPPMKIVYSQTVNKKDRSFHFQSIQPENLVSPLIGSSSALTLISRGNEDVSWAAPQTVSVRLNESMISAGEWLYSIDEVHDAAGNVVNFTDRGEDGEHIYPKGTHLEQGLTVHERPKVLLDGYDSQRPLRVPTGRKVDLPVKFGPIGKSTDNLEHTITWQFSPIDTLTADGDHGTEYVIEEYVSKNPQRRPQVHQPGLYTLKSVRNGFCEGEVKEPSSVLLINPPKPEVSISSEDIFDKCAGNAIGLLVELDLVGTPPFKLRYDMIQNGRVKEHLVREIRGLRDQIELKPRDAGHFEYHLTSIDDAVYTGEQLKDLVLAQDVKPPASAFLTVSGETVQACIDEPVEFDVLLSGEPPFTLEYELVHDGKRSKQKVKDIQHGPYKISTGPLHQGGEYSLALATVQDKTGCKIFLNGEVKINVRRQRPKVSFAKLDGKRTTTTLEGRKINLPLRLEGEHPWQVSYRNLEDPEQIKTATLQASNSFLDISQRGTYELVDVRDRSCPGTVDASAATFDVGWIARPELRFSETAGLVAEGKKQVKREVCEGDVDAMELILAGQSNKVTILLSVLICYQVLRHINSIGNSITSPFMDLLLLLTKRLTLHSALPQFPWIPLELANIHTNLQSCRITRMTTNLENSLRWR